MPVIRLRNLLKSGSSADLERVIQRARELDDLAVILRNALPGELAENLVSANVRENGELVVVTTSSGWAARLRFETDALLCAAKKAGVITDQCRVTVMRP